MSADKLWTVISGIEYQLNILKDKLKTFDEETNQSVDEAYQRGLEDGKKAFDLLDAECDAEYKRGFEDGKAQSERGCEGCKYEDNGKDRSPCDYCCNGYSNQWQAKDDKIEVGDEVNWLGDCFIVTRIFQPHNMKEQCDGIDDDGCVYHDVLMDDLEKTGNHYDISSILKEMQS